MKTYKRLTTYDINQTFEEAAKLTILVIVLILCLFGINLVSIKPVHVETFEAMPNNQGVNLTIV